MEAAKLAIETGAARRVANAEDLARAVKQLYRNPEQRRLMSEAGWHFNQAHQGATQKAMALLEPELARL